MRLLGVKDNSGGLSYHHPFASGQFVFDLTAEPCWASFSLGTCSTGEPLQTSQPQKSGYSNSDYSSSQSGKKSFRLGNLNTWIMSGIVQHSEALPLQQPLSLVTLTCVHSQTDTHTTKHRGFRDVSRRDSTTFCMGVPPLTTRQSIILQSRIPIPPKKCWCPLLSHPPLCVLA